MSQVIVPTHTRSRFRPTDNKRVGRDEGQTRRRSKAASIPVEVLGLFLFLVLGAIGVLLVLEPARAAHVGDTIAARERELALLGLRNEDLKKTVANVQSLEFVEEQARTTLGMVDPGEVKALAVAPTKDYLAAVAEDPAVSTKSGILSFIGRIAGIFRVQEATAKGSR